MSGLEMSSSTVNDPDDSKAFETLSTGMSNLDEAFENEGVRIGSVVSVLSEPACSGDTLLANMISNRPAYYYTFGRSVNQMEEIMSPISNVNEDELQVRTVDSGRPIDSLQQRIEDLSLPQGGMILLDPVNEFENADAGEYRQLLYRVQEKVKEQNGLAVIHGVEAATEPVNRWLTKYISDTVFRIYQEQADEEIKQFLAIEKLYPGQELVSRDARVFQLDVALDIDISTTRNISP